jgi:hypothetical protein
MTDGYGAGLRGEWLKNMQINAARELGMQAKEGAKISIALWRRATMRRGWRPSSAVSEQLVFERRLSLQ